MRALGAAADAGEASLAGPPPPPARGLVPNRPGTSVGPRPGGWGPPTEGECRRANYVPVPGTAEPGSRGRLGWSAGRKSEGQGCAARGRARPEHGSGRPMPTPRPGPQAQVSQ